MEGQVPPEQVTLPKSGGIVRFRDVEDLDGITYNKIRDKALLARRYVITVSEMLRTAAEELITFWDIPGMPNLPLPGEDEGKKMDSLGRLNWKDTRFIQEQLFDAVEILTADTPTDPTEPPTSD